MDDCCLPILLHMSFYQSKAKLFPIHYFVGALMLSAFVLRCFKPDNETDYVSN